MLVGVKPKGRAEGGGGVAQKGREGGDTPLALSTLAATRPWCTFFDCQPCLQDILRKTREITNTDTYTRTYTHTLSRTHKRALVLVPPRLSHDQQVK